MSPDIRRFVVLAEEAGQRLDKVVVSHAPEVGRRRAAELFRGGAVEVRGRVVAKGDLAREGDEVVVDLGPGPLPVAEPNLPLDVEHESATVVVVEKPSGQATAPLRPGERGTLVNALVARYPEMQGVGYRAREPGLLHRLDTQTSGLVIAARTASAFNRLRSELEAGHIEKRYLAVVEASGLSSGGVVESPLAPDAKDSKRVSVASAFAPGAVPAFSRWRSIAVQGRWALVEVSAHRATRHQIRVHLASIGHPIAGDLLYGGAVVERLGDRHALHASYAAWAGDEAVDGFAVEAPLPPEMEALIAG